MVMSTCLSVCLFVRLKRCGHEAAATTGIPKCFLRRKKTYFSVTSMLAAGLSPDVRKCAIFVIKRKHNNLFCEFVLFPNQISLLVTFR